MSLAWIFVLATGALIVIGLAFYAGQLLWQLKIQTEQQKKRKHAFDKEKAIKNIKLSDSINLIAKAMKEKQCEYSEGCLRVWVLMSQYTFDEQVNLEATYPGVFKMYQVVEEMPTHKARKKYSKKEIFNMDKVRINAEKELEDEIKPDLAKLIVEFPADPSSKTISL